MENKTNIQINDKGNGQFEIRDNSMWVTAEAVKVNGFMDRILTKVNVSTSGGMSITQAEAFVEMVNRAIDAAREMDKAS